LAQVLKCNQLTHFNATLKNHNHRWEFARKNKVKVESQ
jgi:hypothetical protein